MKLMPYRKLFSLLFLFLFLGVKGLSYHPITHSNEEDQLKCELCEVAWLQEVTPFQQLPDSGREIVHLEFITTSTTSYFTEAIEDNTAKGDYICRPPPSFL